jgi:hypothetical protein
VENAGGYSLLFRRTGAQRRLSSSGWTHSSKLAQCASASVAQRGKFWGSVAMSQATPALDRGTHRKQCAGTI